MEMIEKAIENALRNSMLSFFRWFLEGLISSSYWICLFICMISLIFYITGSKKAGRWCTGSFVSFIIIQSVGRLLV